MDESTKTHSAKELLRMIQDLELRHAHLKQEMSKLMLSVGGSKPHPQMFNSASANQAICGLVGALEAGVLDPSAMKLTEIQCLNIMQSMGQALHIYDLNWRIIFWNQAAVNLYGYTSAEAYGKTPTELLVEPKDASLSDYLLQRSINGETWSGEFPIKNKRGEMFVVIATNSPFHDANRRVLGAMCVSSDTRPYQVMKQAGRNLDVQQPMQTSIASKISNLASKVKFKMKTIDNYTDHEGGSEVIHYDRTPDALQCDARGHSLYPSGVFFSMGTGEHFSRKFMIGSDNMKESRSGIRKILSSKAEAWMGTKRNMWLQKENEGVVESFHPRFGRFGWHRLDVNREHDPAPQTRSFASEKLDCELSENTNLGGNKIEASGVLISSEHVSSTSSSSSAMSVEGNTIIKVKRETDRLNNEILWEDIITKEQIGQGSCGTVYRALWYGSDVAVKLFMCQDYSNDVILSFRQEVSLMKRLRHPNILLFMGSITSPHLCIVTEFLPRGSLYQILRRNTSGLDWRRRLHMAIDIARGMNYLHHCNPPIIHRDLKSSNLLVDKNWTVKVGDFGLSRVKRQTYLSTRSGKGTPQWMAPEILRNGQADERSDVYSYGVVLWEIVTEKIPWDNLDPMQVIGVVGFMNQRLEIPKDVDPSWASLIDICWRFVGLPLGEMSKIPPIID